MFKKLAIAGFFVMSSSLALAQSAPELNPQLIPGQLTVVCSTLTHLEYVLKEYSEIPLARGLIDRGNTTHSLVIFVNPSTLSFTIAERTPNGLYCVIAVGKDFEPVPKNAREELQKNYDLKNL